MSTNHAKLKNRLILFVVYPGVTLLDVSGPAQVFSSANVELDEESMRYEPIISSYNGGLIETDTGIAFNTRSLNDFSGEMIDTIIVAGGSGVFNAAQNTNIVEWLKRAMPLARRVVSTCMGVFLTAETGLLGNKTVTTHWRWTEKLQADYPELNVVCDPIFIKQENYASSAGVSSGIDLSLSLVEEDHGRHVALSVAKNLVLYLRRSGSQSQFSSTLLFQFSEQSNRFQNLNIWINKNLKKDLSVSVLAERVDMSPRNFSRSYTEHVGLSPGKAVELFRLEKAKLMLETTDIPIKTISVYVGLNDYERMRRTFIRHTGINPNDYRRRFGL